MYINTLKAINIAVDAIKQLPQSPENEQAIERLLNMKSDRYIHWTREMVKDRLDKWAVEHGRNPTVTNLAEPDMPKAVTIQRLFDMRASAFLNIYYPSGTSKRRNTSRYTVKTEEEWVEDFVRQFNEIKPRSAKDYNAKRDEGTPTWLTIAKYLDLSTWRELVLHTGVNTKCLKVQQTSVKEYAVDSTSGLYEKLKVALDMEGNDKK